MWQGKVAQPLKICSKWLVSFLKSTEWTTNWAYHLFKNVYSKLWLQYNLMTTRCSHFPQISCFEFFWGQNGKKDLPITAQHVNHPQIKGLIHLKTPALTHLCLIEGCVVCVGSGSQGFRVWVALHFLQEPVKDKHEWGGSRNSADTLV